MFDKGKREQRHEKEDATFNKMLLWLAGAVVVELIFLLFKRVYINMMWGASVQLGLMYFFRVFRYLGIVLAVAGIVWAVLDYRKGKRVVLPCACAAAALGLWVLTILSYYLLDIGVSILLILPAAAAVLIVIFFLYQRVFFLNALMAAGGLVALWIHRQYNAEHPKMVMAFFVAGFVALAAVLALVFLLHRGDGKLGGVQVMPVGASYLTTWITCAVTAALMALALILGAAGGYYLLFGLAAWVFGQAVFFTVKLM